MWKTILRRTVLMIPQIIILSVLVFFLADFMPGDALSGLIDPNISAEQIAAQREKLGLNKPVVERYIDWVSGILQGDFGRSFKYKQPVMAIIGQRIVPTVSLALFTTILLYILALPLGILAGRYQGTWIDKSINLYNFLTFSIPYFVFALLCLWLFGYVLNILPTRGTVGTGLQPGTAEYLFSRLRHMILPAMTSAFLGTVGTVQYLRTGIIDAKNQDYVRTARAKGVPERVVYNKHIFRNALLPIAAFIGYEITGLISGSIIMERIFGYQGMGLLFFDSVNGRDYTVMMALVLIFGVASLLGTLLSDIIMVFVDPRIRLN